MPIPTTSDTYTGAAGPTADSYEKLASQYASKIRGAPQVKQQIGSQMLAQEGSIEPLAEERAKMIEQLYTADKDLAARYQAPTSEMYIESPLAAQQAISAAEAPMWRGIEKYNTIIGARQKVLGDALDKGMEIYNAGLKASELELDSKYKAWQMAGGGKEESAAEKKEKMKEDLSYEIMQGQGDPNLLDTVMKKYSAYVSPDEILSIYNINSPHGPAKETVAELQSKYRVKLPTDVIAASKEYQAAKEAVDLIARIDAESEKAHRLISLAGTQNPLISGALSYLDPDAQNYQNQREYYAAELAKRLVGSGFKTQILAYLKSLPTVTTSPSERKKSIAQLYDEALFKMQNAQERAGSYALGREDPVDYLATAANKYRTSATVAKKKTTPTIAQPKVPAPTISTGGPEAGGANVWVVKE